MSSTLWLVEERSAGDMEGLYSYRTEDGCDNILDLTTNLPMVNVFKTKKLAREYCSLLQSIPENINKKFRLVRFDRSFEHRRTNE